MAASLNMVQLIGHLGGDPDTRTFQSGGKVVSFSVATSESWKDKSTGERKERTEWHRISVFAEHAADFAEKYLRKGNKVYVQGQLETRKWQDQSGNDRYSTEVVLRPYSGVLNSLEKAPGRDGGGSRDDGRGGGGGGGKSQGGFNTGGGFGDDLDDDVPF